jgi:hypothetical protein
MTDLDVLAGQSMMQVVSKLRLTEREDGGSTCDPGSPFANDLAAEVLRRIDYLRAFAANGDEECRCDHCWRKATAYALDGGDQW